MAEIIAYIVFCLLAGLCGSQRRMGFFGTFIISLLFTPVVVLVVLLLTGPSSRKIQHWGHHSGRQQPN